MISTKYDIYQVCYLPSMISTKYDIYQVWYLPSMISTQYDIYQVWYPPSMISTKYDTEMNDVCWHRTCDSRAFCLQYVTLGRTQFEYL